MGSYTFTWEHAANEVFVTGDFDGWKKTVELEQEDGIFKKTVDLPKAKHQYKFVVDGDWLTNDSHPKEDDGKGNYNNVLYPEEIKEPVSTLSSAAPDSTTAALAGAVPKEEKPKTEESVPGAFPLTPPVATPSSEPQAFSVNPIPATNGPGNPVQLAPGEKVPDPSTLTSNTIQSTVKGDEAPEEGEEKVSVAPIPATAGAGNPIHLAPGEEVPDPSTLTSNTISSTARTDAASYEKSDAQPPQLGPVVTPEAEREAKGDPGVTIQSAAPTSTTAALAAEVPKEPRGVPAPVTESQKEATFPSEASANSTAVEEKKEVEEQLKEKVLEEPPAAESSVAEEVAGTAPPGETAAADAFAAATYSAKEKAAESVGLNGHATVSGEVPEVVTESQKGVHASPEASANGEAVGEKKEAEVELLKEVKKTNEAGEMAPAVTATTSKAANGPSGIDLAGDKPLKSSGEPNALDTPAAAAAQTETAKPVSDSRDVSPMSKQPATTGQTEPTVAASAEPSSTEAKTTAETPKKETATTAKATPESAASTAADKKKKRTSFFGKLKAKFKDF